MIVKWFSRECRFKGFKQKLSNHSSQLSQRTRTILWANQNWKPIHVADAKRGKTRASELQFVLVLLTFDGLTKWLEIVKPNVWRCNAKTKQTKINLRAQLNIALKLTLN